MKKLNFLFLGNSHTYFNDMPEIFRSMCEEGNYCNAGVTMMAYPYVTYGTHLQWETGLRFAFLYGNYDFLIMQQAAHSPCPSREETLRDGSEIIRQARHSGVIPYQILPWAEKRMPEHQADIDSVYHELSQTTGVDLIPVGTIFERAKERADIPSLYWKDGEHGSPWGSYAAAAAIFACLSGISPAGLKNRSFTYTMTDSLSSSQGIWEKQPFLLEPEACRRLQELIWDTVQSSRK